MNRDCFLSSKRIGCTAAQSIMYTTTKVFRRRKEENNEPIEFRYCGNRLPGIGNCCSSVQAVGQAVPMIGFCEVWREEHASLLDQSQCVDSFNPS